MDLSFTPEQTILRDTLSSYLAPRRRDLTMAPRRGDAWRGLVDDIALPSTAVPAEFDGYGGGPVDVMLIMEELGRALAAVPFMHTVLATTALAASPDEPAGSHLRAIAAGRALTVLAHSEYATRFRLESVGASATTDGSIHRISGRKSVVSCAPVATHYLVTARTAFGTPSLFLVDAAAAGITREDFDAIDGEATSNITFGAVEGHLIGREGAAVRLLEPAIDAAIVALGAEAVGIMREMTRQTSAYLRERKQFGQPLVSFQALQHRLADMAIAIEQSVSMVYMATLALQDGEARERAAAAAAMKIAVDRQLRFVSQQAVQLHGGMGITDELAIGRYFKRALVISASFGSGDDHFRRYDELAVKDRTGADGP
ncbi:acyl-CoA dehydrogenase family protein [Pseudaminobacter sp. 19-2017]|uniref:Acyl-CoA dehydrogenase family protein n=1 Tax=Pseudaminobacter soli (ex Zhang et al. 2022) TaxID=2831468 RepID=A0A942E2M3_9HYPH|nr:acyl-CoA dehydrogenase [Pseudaminobacter soli]MBS3651988.1 acyl-CoA dehydrogenase family protein [Pseudaminobacter soli]